MRADQQRRPDRDHHFEKRFAQARVARARHYDEGQAGDHEPPEERQAEQHRQRNRAVRGAPEGFRGDAERPRVPQGAAGLRMREQGRVLQQARCGNRPLGQSGQGAPRKFGQHRKRGFMFRI